MGVLTSRDGDVLIVTLDRPAAGNRLDPPTVEALTAAYTARGCDAPAAIVLTSSGPDFSLGRERPKEAPTDPSVIAAEFERIQRLNESVQRSAAVTLAAVRGRAEGAGLSLAARSDIVIVAEDAQLSFPEIQHGIPPTIVLSHYRYVLPRNVLGDLIFTGRVVTGSEAVTLGLAGRCVADSEVEPLALELSAQIASYDRDSVGLVKRFLQATESVAPQGAPALGIAMYAVEMAHRKLVGEYRGTSPE